MTTGYTSRGGCPTDGAEMVDRGVTYLAPDHAQAEMFCPECLTIWRLDLVLTPIASTTLHDDPRGRAADAIADAGVSVMS